MANILVLDDSKALLETMKAVFQLHNYEVRTAPTKSLLMAHIEIFKPDIILLDVLLDKNDGREICKELKTSNETRNIPVILVSGNHELLLNYEECYADDIMTKPFEFDELERKIKSVLPKNHSGKLSRAIKN